MQQSVVLKYQRHVKFGKRKTFFQEKRIAIVKKKEKKNANVSTNLTTESVHSLNSSFGVFQTFSIFEQYKKDLSVILKLGSNV